VRNLARWHTRLRTHKVGTEGKSSGGYIVGRGWEVGWGPHHKIDVETEDSFVQRFLRAVLALR